MKDMFSIPPKNPDFSSEQVKAFYEIWMEREHKSEVSGATLPYTFQGSMFFVFSHVLSKGACPKLKCDKRFIVLMTLREHQMWENERHKLKDDHRWNWVFELLEEAKRICNE